MKREVGVRASAETSRSCAAPQGARTATSLLRQGHRSHRSGGGAASEGKALDAVWTDIDRLGGEIARSGVPHGMSAAQSVSEAPG